MQGGAIIHVSNLSKVFRVLKRKPGFLGGLRTLFSTTTRRCGRSRISRSRSRRASWSATSGRTAPANRPRSRC